MHSSRFVSLLGIALLAGGAGCRGSEHGAATRFPASERGAAVRPSASDSAAAVQAAVDALNAVPGLGHGTYRVVSFLRDSGGVMVGLRRSDAAGGGGLVSVPRRGPVTVRDVWH